MKVLVFDMLRHVNEDGASPIATVEFRSIERSEENMMCNVSVFLNSGFYIIQLFTYF